MKRLIKYLVIGLLALFLAVVVAVKLQDKAEAPMDEPNFVEIERPDLMPEEKIEWPEVNCENCKG